MTLILLSVERYIAVAHPFKYARLVTSRNVLICIFIVCWSLPIIFYDGFILIRSHYQFTEEVRVCTPAYGDRFVYTLVGLLVFFFPSSLVVGITSVSVHRSLTRHLKQRESMLASAVPGPSSISLPTTSTSSPSPDSGRPSRPSKQELKMFRLVRIVALAFYVCWVPHLAVGLGFLVAGKPAPPNLTFFLYWLRLSGGICNFFIYFLGNSTFRRTATEKMRSCCRSCSGTSQSYSIENRGRQEGGIAVTTVS
ncbi:probable G-protein coupled receptor 21 [Acanthaster planci]|uniref:Probable G-protein coupled receptor 21 n=1 Tax=Acanthaster planci TaxID=133434 RepID=A0A8B8A380_ACAPL|nr:probable G-protein coupled receptor 21 [Acanthaster planci]